MYENVLNMLQSTGLFRCCSVTRGDIESEQQLFVPSTIAQSLLVIPGAIILHTYTCRRLLLYHTIQLKSQESLMLVQHHGDGVGHTNDCYDDLN